MASSEVEHIDVPIHLLFHLRRFRLSTHDKRQTHTRAHSLARSFPSKRDLFNERNVKINILSDSTDVFVLRRENVFFFASIDRVSLLSSDISFIIAVVCIFVLLFEDSAVRTGIYNFFFAARFAPECAQRLFHFSFRKFQYWQ